MKNMIVLAIDFSNLHLAANLKLVRLLSLRLGYDNEKRKEYKIGGTAGLLALILALVFLVSKYNFDYSFSSMGSIGALA